MAIERFERLTDLVAFLLDTREPATLFAIASAVPGYPEGDEACRQAFERDKRVLRDEGIPIREDKGRYRIPPEEYYLPDLGLTSDEQLALRVAVTAVRVGGDAAGSALDKLTLGVTEGPLAGAAIVADLDEHPVLPTLHAALRQRSAATFTYRGEERTVEPSLVWFREGNWYLAAFDRLRGAERNFRVDRITGDITLGEPGEIEPAPRPTTNRGLPIPRQPWLIPGGDRTIAVVLVDEVLSGKAIAEAGHEADIRRHDDGTVTLTLPVTHRDAFRSWLLGLLDHAQLLHPAEMRDELVEWLEAIAAGGPDVA